MKYIPIIIIFLLLTTIAAAAPGDNVGIDPVFEQFGLEKPTEWNTWTQQKKFSYLESTGIYPEYGRKYQGRASEEKYFAWLGIEKPQEWDEMTFEEKNSFVMPIINNKHNDIEENKASEEPTIKSAKTTSTITNKQTTQQKKNNKEPTIYDVFLILFSVTIIIGSFLPTKNSYRKLIRTFTYYGLPVLLIIFSFLYPHRTFFATMGGWAEKLLIFLVFVKPIAIIFKSKFFMRAVTYRRESGVASFWFFLFHAAGLIYVLNLTSITNYLVLFMFFGAIAGLGMIILALTSNDTSVKYFKKNWKKIQYITYPTFLLVLAHSGLFEQGNLIKLYTIGGLFVALKSIEFYLARKRNKKEN